MIKFKIYPKQNKLVVLELNEFSEYKVFRLSDIHSVRFCFFDECENDGFIQFYFKKDINYLTNYNVTQLSILFTEIEAEYEEPLHKMKIYSLLHEYKNGIELYNEDEYGDCLCEYFYKTYLKLSRLNIECIMPEISDSSFSKFVDFENQREAVEWWKEDLLFRYVFSRN